ncbi:alpha/beta hydrolase [Synechococcus sp. CBW1108]|uniref:alpha/beta hydrolase n=1 Tax=Synechococcus sp. CBW1108 TaxID=1353147 RepID=UPI0018CD1AEA|nr:alpha/beta hydrolase [Synechococcus sp. CBW1108]QPN71347.1 alpha/beta hydrolase [Synechococcus sp. CBW1108]
MHRTRVLGRTAAAAVMGMSLLGGLGIWSPPTAGAAENLVFVSGAFRRSIPVADLEKLAATGQAQGLLADVLRFSNQNPKTVGQLLNQSVKLPVTLVSRLLNTRIGEAILERLAQIVFPLNASQAGVVALRSGLVMGVVEGNGSISAISFFRAYPVREMEVSIPALMNLIRKASSITDLVRFFSESPLDGLRGETPKGTP